MSDAIRFTVIRSDSCALAKTFSRDARGNIESSAIAHMTEGHARIAEVRDVSQLVAVLDLLEANEAITCGVPLNGETPLTTRAGAAFRADAIARTNEAFVYPHGPAFFPIDVDIDGDRYRSVEAVLDALEAASPWLRDVHRVARPSSSSYVDTRGLRGVHVYLAVTNGGDIPALAKRMQIEQWERGNGSIKISKSGALLVRQLSDALVYQPSRLMFEAAPVLEGVGRAIPEGQAIVERAPNDVMGRPVSWRAANGRLDVQRLPLVRDIAVRRFETAVREAKNARRKEAKRIAIDYQTNNAIANGLDKAAGERFGLLATRALGEGKLPACWELATKDYGRITVQQMMDNPDAALGMQVADPFDSWRPDLKPAHFTKAEVVMLGDNMGVWSHKLQAFFAFDAEAATDLSAPIELAAEKLCGLIEYPEKMGRAASFVNVKHGLTLLLTEIDAMPRQNVCATAEDEPETGVPLTGALCDALSRIGCIGVKPEGVANAIEVIAQANRFDPWREAVDGLPKWDGVPRLDTVCADIFGDDTGSDAHRLTGQLIFAGPLARQLWPGITCDVVPVLHGAGGERKSTFVKELATVLGAPSPSSFAFGDDRRMSMAAARSIVAEIGEMAGAGRREVEDIKRWIADAVDVYRAPYDRREVAHPRRFFLIGTANKDEMLRDEALARRFMTINVRRTIAGWQSEALQLFAEAKARFCQRREDFDALASAATVAVQAFNIARMQRGEGVANTALTDVLPDVIAGLSRAKASGRFNLAEVMAALAVRPETKNARERDVTEWLMRMGCQRVKSSGRMVYIAPEHLRDGASDEGAATAPGASPFATAAALATMH
ncbi:VapE domain-containing protein [Paraburkholderia mimosarum]|uniref:VapE domain-containing protein n=1 Tax=Paraburkholderia mimosarum TaxID=312026 RepID=UPI0039C2371D